MSGDRVGSCGNAFEPLPGIPWSRMVWKPLQAHREGLMGQKKFDSDSKYRHLKVQLAVLYIEYLPAHLPISNFKLLPSHAETCLHINNL